MVFLCITQQMLKIKKEREYTIFFLHKCFSTVSTVLSRIDIEVFLNVVKAKIPRSAQLSPWPRSAIFEGCAARVFKTRNT